MSINSFFNRSANFVKLDMSAQDASGGIVPVEAVSHAGVRCCISTVSNTERGMYESRGIAATHWLFCSARYAGLVNATHKVHSTHRGVLQKFDVVAMPEDPQSRGQHLKVLLQEMSRDAVR